MNIKYLILLFFFSSFINLSAQNYYKKGALITAEGEKVIGHFRVIKNKMVMQHLNPGASPGYEKIKQWYPAEFKELTVTGRLFKSLLLGNEPVVLKEMLEGNLSLFGYDELKKTGPYFILENGTLEELPSNESGASELQKRLNSLANACSNLTPLSQEEISAGTKAYFESLYNFLIAYNECKYPESKIKQRVVADKKVLTLGLFVGPNLTSINGIEPDLYFQASHFFLNAEKRLIPSFQVGLSVELKASKNINFGLETAYLIKRIGYTRPQASQSPVIYDGDLTLHNLQFNVFSKYTFGENDLKPYLTFGIVGQNLINDTNSWEVTGAPVGYNAPPNIILFNWDIGLGGGIGIEKTINKLDFGFEARLVWSRPTATYAPVYDSYSFQGLFKVGF